MQDGWPRTTSSAASALVNRLNVQPFYSVSPSSAWEDGKELIDIVLLSPTKPNVKRSRRLVSPPHPFIPLGCFMALADKGDRFSGVFF